MNALFTASPAQVKGRRPPSGARATGAAATGSGAVAADGAGAAGLALAAAGAAGAAPPRLASRAEKSSSALLPRMRQSPFHFSSK
jgi:hypothetical protein